MIKVRKISHNELMYCDLQDISQTSFSIQYLIEYRDKIQKDIVEKALFLMKKENPAVFVRAENNFWVESDFLNAVEEVEINDANFLDNDLFFEKTDYKKETVRLYILTANSKNYLLIKLFHSVFDGKGALLFVEKLISYINNSDCDTELNNSVTDDEFIKDLECKNIRHDLSQKYRLSDNVSNNRNSVKYKQIILPKYHQGIIAKMAKTFSEFFEEKTVRFMIPTDIRRHKPENYYVSNLVLPIFLDVSKDDNWENVNAKLFLELRNKNELNIKSANHFGYNHIPAFVRKFFLNLLINQKSKRKEFLIGGIISHLGKIDIKKFNMGKNEALSFLSLPVQQPLSAFSVVLSEFNNETRMAVSYFEGCTPNSVIEDFEKNLKNICIKKINYDFNKTDTTNCVNFIEKIFSNIETYSSKTAVWDDKQYSYNELSIRINQISKVLKEKNVCAGDRVILHINRSFDYIASILAVLKIGASFVPVDKNEKEYKLSQIISLTSAKIILTDYEKDFSNILSVNVKNINEQNTFADKNHSFDNDDEVYCIFTSGTTGNPKGVCINVENFSNYINWAKKTYTSQNRIIMPLFTSLSVDLTMTSVFLPLITGGGIKIFKDDFNNLILDKIYKDTEINTVKCTPGHLTLFDKNTSYPPKERLIVGGEIFPKKLSKTLSDSNINIVNEYGPTETTVGSLFHIVSPDDKSEDVPIGLPVDNTEVFLVNENASLVENESEIGEIVICGKGVAKGYLNVKNEDFKTFNGKQCYYTGDFGYFENGTFHCWGRKDSRIKINGQRIELGEINFRLTEIDDIQSAYTIFYKNQIVSFVVKIENSQISEEKILQSLTSKLPNYAIPRTVKFVDKFLLADNGKIDEKYLMSLVNDINSPVLSDESITDPLKKLIDELFSDSMPDLSKNNLHDIGLNSLDILIFGQELAQKYIPRPQQDDFMQNYIKNIPNSNLEIIKNIIENFGGNL